MALVEGEQSLRPMTLSRYHHAQVGEADIKVLVAALEICDHGVLLRF